MRARLLIASLLLLTIQSFATVSYTHTYKPDPTNNTPGYVVTGDYNRDGLPDIAMVTGQYGGAYVVVYLATSKGSFDSGTAYSVSTFPQKVVAADLNNDGNLDLVVSYSDLNYLTVLWGSKNGTFTTGADVTFAQTVLDFAIGDVNGDGKLDIAMLIGPPDQGGASTLQIEKGTGTGTFTTGQTTKMASWASNIWLSDINGDGYLDVVNIRGSSVLIWPGNGKGNFASPTSLTPPTVCTASDQCADDLWSLVVADFNNDAKLDLAVVQSHLCGSACGSNTIYVYKNLGGLTFSRSSFEDQEPAGVQIMASDLNGDQNQDLVMYSGNEFGPSETYALGNGNGTFGAVVTGTPGSNFDLGFPSWVTDRDLNLDSKHDLVTADWQDGGIIVAMNTGAYINCAPPGSSTLQAKLCEPTQGSNEVTNSVTVKASGNSPAGVQRMEIWVDGVKKAERRSDQISVKFTVSSGTHQVTAVAVDKFKGTTRDTSTIYVP